MADDLIDEPPDGLPTSTWISRLSDHLDLVYKRKLGTAPSVQADLVRAYIESEFPASARSALIHLPTSLLPSEPIYRLLQGFTTDSGFRPAHESGGHFPIANEEDLYKYGSQVAGTVGQLCVALISHHSREPIDPALLEEVASAAGMMGIALQYVNIARDIAVDAVMGRVYLPTTWLEEEGLTPQMVIDTITTGNKTSKRQDHWAKLMSLRKSLLEKAFTMYVEARPTMDFLPDESRRPMIVAVESYMEIGRVLREQEGILLGVMGAGRLRRATVPKLRRLRVALRALLYA